MVESAGSLQAVALLIDELNSEDNKIRLNAVRNIQTISIAIGPERTRKQLLPFLHDLIDDDDEILIALSESLQKMIYYIGGPQYIMHLVQLLEQLCHVQESSVREKATETIKLVLEKAKISDFEGPLYEMIKRMVSGDWFTSKLPVAALVPYFYIHSFHKIQQEYLKIYVRLSEDSVPQVRKAVAQHLKEFIALIPKLDKPPERELLNIFDRLAKDEHDSVKILAMDNCLEFLKVLSHTKATAGLLPFVKTYAESEAWRLRYLVADKIVDLAQGIGPESMIAHLLPYYVKFLDDPESEVRTAAVSRLGEFAKMLNGQDIVKKIAPCLKKLSNDTFQYVRGALADNILFLCPLIGKANTNEFILGVFLTLLRDDSPDVRLNLFKGLEEFNKVIGVETLAQSLVPAINELATDKNWRTRLTIIEKFPVLARQLGEGFFSDKLGQICLDWLNDKVFAIREAGIANLRELCQIVGPKWLEKLAIPKILSFQRDTNYLYRLTTLFAITKLAEFLPTESFQRVIIPAIVVMASDKVPNVRMNVAKTLRECRKYVKDKEVNNRIYIALGGLSKDSDFDVAYHAKIALEA